MEKDTKITIERAWNILFEKHDIIAKVSVKGSFKIKASEINGLPDYH